MSEDAVRTSSGLPPAPPDTATIAAENGARVALATSLGLTMLDMLAKAHDEEAALAFARAVVDPTSPGTVARDKQDRAWSLLTARLSKLAGEAA